MAAQVKAPRMPASARHPQDSGVLWLPPKCRSPQGVHQDRTKDQARGAAGEVRTDPTRHSAGRAG